MSNINEEYLSALKFSKGQIDEITLGEKLGLTEEQTRKVIRELETEGKIVFNSFGLCSYKPNPLSSD